MAGKERSASGRKPRRPELEPYAPPGHPDVHVPEQQFEGNPRKSDKESRATPK